MIVGPSGLVLHGTFGGDEGQVADTGTWIDCGLYSIENLVTVKMDIESGLGEGQLLETALYSLKSMDTRFVTN